MKFETSETGMVWRQGTDSEAAQEFLEAFNVLADYRIYCPSCKYEDRFQDFGSVRGKEISMSLERSRPAVRTVFPGVVRISGAVR